MISFEYSEVPNRRADRNKRAGLEKSATLLAYLLSKLINEQGGILRLLHEKSWEGWKENLKNLSEHALLLGTSEYVDSYAKNFFEFLPPVKKLHNPHCHNPATQYYKCKLCLSWTELAKSTFWKCHFDRASLLFCQAKCRQKPLTAWRTVSIQDHTIIRSTREHILLLYQAQKLESTKSNSSSYPLQKLNLDKKQINQYSSRMKALR